VSCVIKPENIFWNVRASTKIMLGKRDGLGEINRSAEGFWQSFMALVLALPFSFSTRYSEYYQALQQHSIEQSTGLFYYLVSLEFGAIAAYLVSLVALYAMTRSAGIEDRYPLSVVCLNWSSLAMTIISFPAIVIMNGMSGAETGQNSGALPFLVLILVAIFMLAMFNVIRLSLQLSNGPAVLYVFVMSVFEFISYFVILNLAGF